MPVAIIEIPSIKLKQPVVEGITEEEINVIKRARNYKSNSHPKNCDIITYKHATGLEALIGYLELLGRRERIDEIMKNILGGV